MKNPIVTSVATTLITLAVLAIIWVLLSRYWPQHGELPDIRKDKGGAPGDVIQIN